MLLHVFVRSSFSRLKLFGGFFLQSQNVEDVSGYVCCRACHGVWPGCRSTREVARSSERRTSCCRACSTVCGRLRLVFCLQPCRAEALRVKTLQDLLVFLPRSGRKMAVFTSAYGDCFHVRRDCHGLRNADPRRIATKVACEYCLRDLHLVPPTASASWGGVENQCSAQ